MSVEQEKKPAEIQPLSPEQKRGLKIVEFDLFVPVSAKSIGQLLREEPNHFGYVHHSKSLQAIVPPGAEVAVRSGEPAIDGSNDLNLDDQRQCVVDLERSLRRKKLPKGATLTGVEFGLDHASTHVQIDIMHQQTKGGLLYVAQSARTEDPTSSSEGAIVGRAHGYSGLRVSDWANRHGSPYIVAVPVARPARK